MINSRPVCFLRPLACARRDPFSRSYGVRLPSSLTAVLSSALGYSPRLPVSVLVRSTLSSPARSSRPFRHRLRQQSGLEMMAYATPCYPRGTFYPLSYGASTRYHRITKAAFQLCSCRSTRSQAGFYLYARRTIANRSEPAFALLRYSFGGDRPSQTNRLAVFPCRIHGKG